MKEEKDKSDEKTPDIVNRVKEAFLQLGEAHDRAYSEQANIFQKLLEAGELNNDNPEQVQALTSAMSFSETSLSSEDAKKLRTIAQEHDLVIEQEFELDLLPASTEKDTAALAEHLNKTHPNLTLTLNSSSEGCVFQVKGLPQDILSAIDYLRYALMQRPDVQKGIREAHNHDILSEAEYEAFEESFGQAEEELKFLYD